MGRRVFSIATRGGLSVNAVRAQFTVTIFFGAVLLFLVQPMFARMTLPLLGGAPAVWNTSMVFFQAMLLAGYGYAHWLATRHPTRRQVWCHAIVVLLPLLVLPLAPPEGWTPPRDRDPTWALLGVMLVTVGPPFFVLSTTSPLMQRWFAGSRDPHARDPYFLYAASNLGSLLALLCYPLAVEPWLRMADQTRLFSASYVVFALLLLASGGIVWRQRFGAADRGPAASDVIESNATGDAPRVPEQTLIQERLGWVLLSLIPSSLMLGVTNFITSDIASVPLLWVIPLGLYLLTFVIVFARRRVLSRKVCERVLRVLLVALFFALALGFASPMAILVPLHLVSFFLIALLCHWRLAASRPAASRLTEFYFCLSLGGVAGGAFNALVAPALFDSIMEYPLALVVGAALALGVGRIATHRDEWVGAVGAVGAAVALGGVVWFLVWLEPRLSASGAREFGTVVVALPLVIAFVLSGRPLRYVLCLAAILIASSSRPGSHGEVLYQERTFFGVHRVTLHPNGRFRQLLHGNTLHGWQDVNPERASEPLTYFHRTGPIGQALDRLPKSVRNRVAVIGLGAGSMAAHSLPGEMWTFFEIDPTVAKIATDPKHFSYLQNAEGEIRIVLGDARLTLDEEADGTFGMIILDAYSSDAIPMHLVTREAFALYRQKLEPDGVLALHISNRNLDLAPVLMDLVRDAGLVGFVQDEDHLVDYELQSGKLPSKWMVVARRREDLGDLPSVALWHPVEGEPERRIWTDDYYSIVRLLQW